VPTLFDPLRYLREELHAKVFVDDMGAIRANLSRWDNKPIQQHRVRWCIENYEPLIKLQLEHGGASVQKLLAQGHLELENGRYRRK
jgi:hypothetical protein